MAVKSKEQFSERFELFVESLAFIFKVKDINESNDEVREYLQDFEYLPKNQNGCLALSSKAKSFSSELKESELIFPYFFAWVKQGLEYYPVDEQKPKMREIQAMFENFKE
jgi:hypothetical protein